MGQVAQRLIKKNHIISEQMRADEMLVLLTELERVLQAGVAGDVVEMGCFYGTSALFEQRMLSELAPDKTLWLYDSFEGLPTKQKEDGSGIGELFREGQLKATESQLKRNFTKADLKFPQIKKAWFWELDPADLPQQICFAFLDGDFYDSILDSLKLVCPKMSAGSVIVIDDYDNAKLPGVKRAVEEFFNGNEVKIRVQKSLAIILR